MGSFRDRVGAASSSEVQTSKTIPDKIQSQDNSNDGKCNGGTNSKKGVSYSGTSTKFDRLDRNLLIWAVREWITRYENKKGAQTQTNVGYMKELLEKVKKL